MPGEHGLANDVGRYNCFLNVVVQALWHLHSVRTDFHAHKHAAQRTGAQRVQQYEEAERMDSSSAGEGHLAAAAAGGGGGGGGGLGDGSVLDDNAAAPAWRELAKWGHFHSRASRMASAAAGGAGGGGGDSASAAGALDVAGACVFCALDAIFTDLEFAAPGVAVDVEALRRAMASLHRSSGRFQMREIDDAAEAFDALADRLHDLLVLPSPPSSSPSPSSSADAAPPCRCFAHSLFAVETSAETVCDACRATAAPSASFEQRHSEQFLLYTYAAQLRTAARTFNEQQAIMAAALGSSRPAPLTFDLLMHLAANADTGDMRACTVPLAAAAAPRAAPRAGQASSADEVNEAPRCGRSTRVQHTLRSLPSVLPIGIVWDTPDASAADIELLLSTISLRIDAAQIFDRVAPAALRENTSAAPGAADSSGAAAGGARNATRYALRGMICYYGQHYMGFFWSEDERRWLYFDDTTVRVPGIRGRSGQVEGDGRDHQNFSSVCRQCVAGRLQPNVLFYEREAVAGVYDDHDEQTLRSGGGGISISGLSGGAGGNNPDSNNNTTPGTKTPDATAAQKKKVTSFHGIVVSELAENAAAQAATQTHAEGGTERKPDPLAGSPTTSSEEFVLVSGDDEATARLVQTTVDVSIFRTNWFYRRDERVLHLAPTHFARLPPTVAASSPGSQADDENALPVDETRSFRYEDVLEVSLPAGAEPQCEIRFREGTPHAADPQFITTRSEADLGTILSQLRVRCEHVGNILPEYERP